MYGRNQVLAAGGIPGMTPMVQRIVIANSVIWLLQLVGGRNGVPLTELGEVSVPGVFSHGFRLGAVHLHVAALDRHRPAPRCSTCSRCGCSAGSSRWSGARGASCASTCSAASARASIILGWNACWSESVRLVRPTLGASGAIYGVLTAFSLLWPDRTIMLLFPPIPIRAIWFIPLLFAMQLAMLRQRQREHRSVTSAACSSPAALLRTELRACSACARCATAGTACACAIGCARCAATSGRSGATTTPTTTRPTAGH